MTENQEKMKVTVLSGFLGAGKTTLLKKILTENNKDTKNNSKIAVIVNDMGELNLDAEYIKKANIIQEDAEMVEMHNGCICCTLREDLLKTVKQLGEEKKYDILLIESSGISEPLPVAQTFVMDVKDTESEKIISLSDYAILDTMVTVIDVLNIFDILDSLDTLADKENLVNMKGDEKNDKRSICNLMIDQIEFADVIILNKINILEMNNEKIQKIKFLIKKLNPCAYIILSHKENYQDIDIKKEILNTGRFDMEKSSTSAGWIQELYNPEHTPEIEEYGISSIIFRNNSVPFHPARIKYIFDNFGDYRSAMEISKKGEKQNKLFSGIVRSKGSIWVANSLNFPIDLHISGKHILMVKNKVPWLSSIDVKNWNENDHNYKKIRTENGTWHSKFGDRCTELIFIGVNLDKQKLCETLKTALLTEEELIFFNKENGFL